MAITGWKKQMVNLVASGSFLRAVSTSRWVQVDATPAPGHKTPGHQQVAEAPQESWGAPGETNSVWGASSHAFLEVGTPPSFCPQPPA